MTKTLQKSLLYLLIGISVILGAYQVGEHKLYPFYYSYKHHQSLYKQQRAFYKRIDLKYFKQLNIGYELAGFHDTDVGSGIRGMSYDTKNISFIMYLFRLPVMTELLLFMYMIIRKLKRMPVSFVRSF